MDSGTQLRLQVSPDFVKRVKIAFGSILDIDVRLHFDANILPKARHTPGQFLLVTLIAD